MKKILFLFVLLLIVVSGVFFVQQYLREGKISLFEKKSTVTIGDQKINVSVADSQKEREIGLSETQALAKNQGMIFLFEKPDYYYFWMKNMKFPIDIIYINKDEIVSIEKNAQPAKNNESPIIYAPTQPADKVLEIQSGLSEQYDFKKGDKIKLDL